MAYNPFYVQPGGDFSQALGGLSQTLRDVGEQREETERQEAAQLQKQQMQGEIFDAMESNIPGELAKVSIKYPEMAQSIKTSLGIQSEAQDREAKDFMRDVMINPERAEELFKNRAGKLEAQRRDAKHSRQSYQDFLKNPQNELKKMEKLYEVLAPEEYKAFKDEEIKSKVVGNYLVNDTTGNVIFDATDKKPVAKEKVKDANDRWRFVDSGKLVFPQVAKVEEGISGSDKFKQSKDIRGEISKANSDFTAIANSWDRIAASANDVSAAGDLALIFNFMKMLDPGSTVREGEFATAANTAGVPDRISAQYNKILTGERLAEPQRADFLNQAQNIFGASSDRADKITEEYVRVAERAGLDREDVVISRGAAPNISTPASSAPPQGKVTFLGFE